LNFDNDRIIMKQTLRANVSPHAVMRLTSTASVGSHSLPRILTLVAVLASAGFITLAPVQADAAVELVKRGEDGEDGSSAFTWTNATPGKNAESVSLSQTMPIHESTSTLIRVGSQGGAGGSVYTKGVFHNVPGKPGGHAGSVNLSVSESADLSAT